MDLLKNLSRNLVGIDNKPLDPTRIGILESLLKQTYGEQVQIGYYERLRSKKNVVLLMNLRTEPVSHLAPVIAKLYISDTFEKEKQVLEYSLHNGLIVPDIIAAERGVLLMYHLRGEPLVDVINKSFDPSLIDKLAKWYYQFHSLHHLIKGDPRLRNFILSDDILYGLDFEETSDGHWMSDIAGISASLLDTDPIYDERKIAC